MPYDVDTVTALASGAIVVRDILTVAGKTLGGSPAEWAFWTGEDNVAVNLLPLGETTPVSRNVVGGGTLLNVPAIVDAIGIEARSVAFGLDHITDAAGGPMDMVYGNNVRVARVEMHRALFDPATWNLVATPVLIFAGRVDGAAVDDAAAGGEGGLSLDAISSAIDLTRTNPAMESDEQQRRRDGDRFRKDSDTAGQIERWWGQAKGNT
ncbi:hypothetical protein [Devosia sp. Root635]|uniref:hypothetical protein n=1 Tax=Devosia sp. Root635 TaxID=1736575 RepID=UPI0006FE282B|nr:hypothetical protein [Devosia sp. Root635]KRA42089.1 hypothetical protein ASD80_10200 [Devosia sp. Root635]